MAIMGGLLLLGALPTQAPASRLPALLMVVVAPSDTSVLERARGFYREEQYSDAISLLAAELESREQPRRLRISLLVMLARCYARLGRTAELDATVYELVGLSPSYRPDVDRIPPQECSPMEVARGRARDRDARRIRFGVLAGASWSRFRGSGVDDIGRSASALGASFCNRDLRASTGGVIVHVPLRRGVALEPQASLMRRGGVFEVESAFGDFYREEYCLDCVEVALPVAVLVLPKRRVGPLVLVGPVASVRVGSEGSITSTVGQSKGNLGDLSSRVTWGGMAGVGLWARNVWGADWQASGEYHHELTDAFRSSSLRSNVRTSGYILRLACLPRLGVGR
jgi:hypothetical protein